MTEVGTRPRVEDAELEAVILILKNALGHSPNRPIPATGDDRLIAVRRTRQLASLLNGFEQDELALRQEF